MYVSTQRYFLLASLKYHVCSSTSESLLILSVTMYICGSITSPAVAIKTPVSVTLATVIHTSSML